MSKTLKIQTDPISADVGVDDQKREEVAKALTPFLATTYTLYMKTLYYHWNVTGPHFHGLHELFEQQYEALHEAGDELAERIRALGMYTEGTFRSYIELSAIEEDKKLPANATDMVSNLLKDNEKASLEARKVLKIAEEAEDEVTVDMMVERMTYHDETAWMLRATNENQ